MLSRNCTILLIIALATYIVRWFGLVVTLENILIENRDFYA